MNLKRTYTLLKSHFFLSLDLSFHNYSVHLVTVLMQMDLYSILQDQNMKIAMCPILILQSSSSSGFIFTLHIFTLIQVFK